MSDQKLMELKNQFLSQRGASFDRWIDRTQSPIEALFVGALLCLGFREPTQDESVLSISTMSKKRGWRPSHGLITEHGLVALVQQPMTVGDLYIVVDVVLMTSDRVVCVEIDGHDFHERTKEQAKRDRNRDRVLTDAGHHPVRFTGSEVYAAPRAAALCAIKLVDDDSYNAEWGEGALGL